MITSVIGSIFFIKSVFAISVAALNARGFYPEKCYQHPAKRHCETINQKQHCQLEIFPNRNTAVFFDLLESDAKIKKKSVHLMDYGIFTFKVLEMSSKVLRAKPLSVKRVSLENWESVQDFVAKAKLVSCDK